MNTSVLETCPEPFGRLCGQAIEWLDEDRAIVVDVRFLQCNHATDFEIAKDATQRIKWICRIHEHEASDDRVHSRANLNCAEIANRETYVSQTIRRSALLGERHLGGVQVCTDYAAAQPYKARRQECDITRSGSDIKNVHP